MNMHVQPVELAYSDRTMEKLNRTQAETAELIENLRTRLRPLSTIPEPSLEETVDGLNPSNSELRTQMINCAHFQEYLNHELTALIENLDF